MSKLNKYYSLLLIIPVMILFTNARIMNLDQDAEVLEKREFETVGNFGSGITYLRFNTINWNLPLFLFNLGFQ